MVLLLLPVLRGGVAAVSLRKFKCLVQCSSAVPGAAGSAWSASSSAWPTAPVFFPRRGCEAPGRPRPGGLHVEIMCTVQCYADLCLHFLNEKCVLRINIKQKDKAPSRKNAEVGACY